MSQVGKEWLSTTYRRMAYDFHVPDTREDFLSQLDPELTADVLSDAGVQALQLCAKSYWGLSLHPTTVGKQHPLLNGRDYFGEVVEALNSKGLKSLGYIIDFWDNHAATAHPAWRFLSLEESKSGRKDDSSSRVLTLCPSSEYEQYLRDQNDEVARNYPVAGIFNDMVGFLDFCYCESCQKKYRDEIGKPIPEKEDWSDPAWREYVEWRYRTTERNLAGRKERLRQIDPTLVFGHNYFGSPFHHYGLSHDPVRAHAHADFMTTETTPWDRGFGLRGSSLGAKLARDLSDGKPYEAVGARCATFHDFTEKSISELMLDGYSTVIHDCPYVVIESASMFGPPIKEGFSLIKPVFRRIEELEPWIEGSELVPHVGILYSRASADMFSTADKSRVMTELSGVYKICIENHLPVEFIFDPTMRPERLERLNVLLLADAALLSEDEAAMIAEFVRGGGGLVATGESSLATWDGSLRENFQLADVFGCDRSGDPSDDITWLRAAMASGGPDIAAELSTSFVLFKEKPSYVPVQARAGATVVCERYDAPFPQPSGRAHSSHFEPPYHPTGEPLVIANEYGKGRAVYVSTRAGTAYAENGYHHIRRFLTSSIDWAARESPPIETNAPMSVETVLNRQDDRLIVHLVNFSVSAPFPSSAMDFPGAGLGPIRKSWLSYDEVIPVGEVSVRIRSDARPRRAYTVPSRAELAFAHTDRYVELTIPRLEDALTVCLEFD